MKKAHIIVNMLILIVLLAILIVFLIAGSQMVSRAVTMKPQKYARDPHGVYTSAITSAVKKKAKNAHKAIRKGKKKHYWMKVKHTKDARAVLAYMSEVYLPYQEDQEYPDCDNVFRSVKGGGYKIDLHPKLYKKLRKKDRYVRNIVKAAICSMHITTFTTEREAVEKVNKWICDRADYDWRVNDPKAYTFNWNAYQALKSGVCVCEGYADLFQIFMTELGVRAYRQENVDHIWNTVVIDGEPLQVDACWNDNGGSYKWMLAKVFEDHGKTVGIRDKRSVTFPAKRIFYNEKRGY